MKDINTEMRWSTTQTACWVLLAVYLLILVVVNFMMALGDLPLDNPTTAGFLLGITFAQAAVVAIYLAWGKQPFASRFVITLCVLAWTGFGIYCSTNQPLDLFLILTMLLPPSLCVANAIPLATMRLIYGARLQWHNDIPSAEARVAYQFGIRQLLIATTVVAGSLGVSRLAFRQWGDTLSGDDLVDIAIIVATLLVCSVVSSWVTVLGCLATRSLWWLLPVVLFCVGTSHLEVLMFQWSTGRQSPEATRVFYTLQGTQLGVTAWPLLVLRGCGLHLSVGTTRKDQ